MPPTTFGLVITDVVHSPKVLCIHSKTCHVFHLWTQPCYSYVGLELLNQIVSPLSIISFEITPSAQERSSHFVCWTLFCLDNRVLLYIQILVYSFIERLCKTSNIGPNRVQVVLLCSPDIILFVGLLTCHDWLTLLWELEGVLCQGFE